MNRIACVDLPEFPLQLLVQQHPDWARLPAAVVDRDAAQGTILAVNARARRLRILPGMRYAAALSLSSQLRARTVPEGEVREALDTVAAHLRFFSAGVEPSGEEPGVFWLDASGLSLLYPSLARWAALIHDDLTAMGYHAAVVTGFSRFGTYAVAKTTRGVRTFDSPGAEREASQRVPIDRLGIGDGGLRDALARLGITTVGGFLALPANGVKKRFGADVHRLHALARGELFAPLQPQIPQEPLTASVHLDQPETSVERLMAVVERALRALATRLGERSEVLSAVVLRLGFDDGGATTERLQPASPTLEVERVVELVRLRLGVVMGEALGARAVSNGVTNVDVEAVGAPAMRSQGELFAERSPRDAAAAARAFARLRAEMGDDAVVTAVLRDGHLPEARFAWRPAGTLPAPRPRPVRHPPLVRRIYAQPVVFSPAQHRDAEVQLAAHIDDGSIRETLGPFVVSGGWWHREVHREYYYVRTASGRTLWMYYDRRRRCWFIHGEVE